MASIWVIEQGVYSDYRVVGVFTSKENAKKVCDFINAKETYEKSEIAEWPLDPCVDALNAGLTQWIVHMRYDGSTEKLAQQDSTYDLDGSVSIWRRTTAPAYRDNPAIRDVLTAVVWASDSNHALKIMNERRVQMIASGQFQP